MRICTVDSPLDAGELLADRIAARLAERGRFVLGAPAGRTPLTTYQALSRRPDHLSGLVVAMMDEYLVDGRWCDPAAHHSCRRFAREALPGVEQIHFPDPLCPEAYDGWLAGLGGADLFLLASGASDGHVGFNPPGTPLESASRVVELAETTRRDNLATFPEFEGLDEVPTHGVTVGLRAITGAAEAVLVLLGADKRESFRRVTKADGYDASWPATVIRACRGGWILADRAAAG
jgi:glucosamine-6-phosphate deaminase